MHFSHRRVARLRGRRSVNGGAHISPPPQRRTRLTRRQAKEMIHTWDQQITRLRRRVDELEVQNAKLADSLALAVRICDEAIAAERDAAPISLHIANGCRFLWLQAVSLPSQLRLSWRPLVFSVLSVTHLALPSRRKIERTVGWPFEPGLDGPAIVGCASAPLSTEHSQVPPHGIREPVRRGSGTMDSIIYLVGLIVVVMFILSLLGLN
jgi:hypothetical protein